MNNNRKSTKGRPTQTIIEAATLTRTNKLGKQVKIPNPKAGIRKQVRHLPN